MGESKHTPGRLQIVFDGPPGPTAGRFVEVERDGRSLKAGEWHQRPDGCWVLEINPGTAAPLMLEALWSVGERIKRAREDGTKHIYISCGEGGDADAILAAIKAATGGAE